VSYGLLVDVTRCTGCERCCDACAWANQLDPAAAAADRATTRDGLSCNRLVSVVAAGHGRLVRKSCLHCLEPSCAAACLVGAIQRTPEGPVVYEPARCIGCRYCMLACPLAVPRYEWNATRPFVRKCSLCAERLRSGAAVPACVEACPHGALKFGQREDLLDEAHALLRHAPSRYLPRVWGESEWGGTSLLYISDVDLTSIGWPAANAPPIPSFTDPVIHKTPLLAGSVFFGVWALGAIVARRRRLMTAAQRESEQAETPADEGMS
jgi:formate dehydrogenase iron-sulfur subunit